MEQTNMNALLAFKVPEIA